MILRLFPPPPSVPDALPPPLSKYLDVCWHLTPPPFPPVTLSLPPPRPLPHCGKTTNEQGVDLDDSHRHTRSMESNASSEGFIGTEQIQPMMNLVEVCCNCHGS